MDEPFKRLDRAKSQAFVRDILAIYAKYGLAISHEDGSGSFIIDRDATDLRARLLLAANGSEIDADNVFSNSEMMEEPLRLAPVVRT
ncbi:MAG: hypothetical protein J0I77_17650 [Rudaea sp.]|uniref:hypothetical protein n=1 Tax=unclassified Rudaea TaxID=2627037 RepID=UPI0010F65DDD|nr:MULTISPECIES: hypothetical protein [unclassified Rudaea]MBN8887553.1 hypothetical protein [Rudaea sp.]